MVGHATDRPQGLRRSRRALCDLDRSRSGWRPLAGTRRQRARSPSALAALEAFRIAEGIPAYGVDMVERDLPQETSQMRALHFNKGCYLGQEIVERIRSRGNVHRHLRQLELEGPLPEPGAKLTVDGAEAGHITSAAELPLSGGHTHLRPRHDPRRGRSRATCRSTTQRARPAGTARILPSRLPSNLCGKIET